ncbi:LysM peptidoglycan-binding domain-containing protein [uncultured Deinococcus sp.]|uniref:LysM peptidoglycan-binding domain-containing protein n=1 Tax=uncultured Deinococcus sp. TaxID=158789 RepID=UPI002587BA92|nr:LysM peptidoglycan-binding domain-containing protein [uncultured Deinococcus sp.]
MRARSLLAALTLTLGGLAGAAGYTVQTGDTLYNVARRSGSTVEALMALNRLSTSTLQLGQVLTLPGGVSVLPPLPPAGSVGTVAQPGPAAVQPAAQVLGPAPQTAPVVLSATPIRAPQRPTSTRLERGLFTPSRLPVAAGPTLRAASTGGGFGARPQSVYLQVGYEAQTFNNCGPASVASVMRAFGKQVSQRDYQQVLRPTGGYTQTRDVSDLLVRQGFRAPLRRSGTVEAIKDELAAGHPVIVLQYHSVYGKTPHFRVVRGYDETQGILIMSDSISGPNVALTERDFDVLWDMQGRQYIPVSRG